MSTTGEMSANACWFVPNVLLKSIKSDVFDLALGCTYLESNGDDACLSPAAGPLRPGDGGPSSSTSTITACLSIEVIPDFIEAVPDNIETGFSRSLLIGSADFCWLTFWPFNSDSVIVFRTWVILSIFASYFWTDPSNFSMLSVSTFSILDWMRGLKVL